MGCTSSPAFPAGLTRVRWSRLELLDIGWSGAVFGWSGAAVGRVCRRGGAGVGGHPGVAGAVAPGVAAAGRVGRSALRGPGQRPRADLFDEGTDESQFSLAHVSDVLGLDQVDPVHAGP